MAKRKFFGLADNPSPIYEPVAYVIDGDVII